MHPLGGLEVLHAEDIIELSGGALHVVVDDEVIIIRSQGNFILPAHKLLSAFYVGGLIVHQHQLAVVLLKTAVDDALS